MEHADQKTGTEKIFQRVEQILGIDVRSLGLFRVALGALILIDLAVRFGALEAHYTDAGVVPRHLVWQHGEQPVFLSIHLLSGSMYWQALLFIVATVSAVALLIGYRSRLACFMCWVLMLSLHVRNPYVNNLGDWLLVDLLFWSMFLPLGRRFSIDALSSITPIKKDEQVLSLASMAILFQMIVVYFFSVDHKISPIWHTEGSAVYYALSLDRLVTSFGQELLNLPAEWFQGATFGTLLLERWGPVLVFIPVFTTFVRTSTVLAFWTFHLGLAMSMTLGIFPYICIAGWLLFVPGAVWDKLSHVGGSIMIRLFNKWNSILGSIKWLSGRRIEYSRRASELGVLGSSVVIAGLFFTLSSNMLYTGMMREGYYENVFKYIEPVGNSLNLRQRWNMFAPHPPTKDGWFIAIANTEEGVPIDILAGKTEINWQRPQSVSSSYVNQRWRKYYEWVMNKWDPHARYLSEYLLARVERERSSIQSLELLFMEEVTLPEGKSSTVQRRQLYFLKN